MTRYFRLLLSVALLSALVPRLYGGAKFHRSNIPDQNVPVHFPAAPTFVVPFQTLSLATSDSLGTFPYVRQLQASIEKELTGAFSVVQSHNDGTLYLSVLEYVQPNARSYSVMESRNSFTGLSQNLENGKLGWAKVLVGQKVSVQYWEAHGLITLKSVLKDNKIGKNIDESIIKVPFQMKRETAVNNVAVVDVNALPNAQSILDALLQTAARKVRRRYAVGLDERLLKLPLDDELLPGDRLALEDNWEGALTAWKSVTMKSNPADLQYCLALANLELGFKAFSDTKESGAATPMLTEAGRQLAEAQRLDPSETYFKEVDSLVLVAKGDMEKSMEQAKALDLINERHRDALADSSGNTQTSGGKSIDVNRPDSPAEAEFRNYLRLQWKNRTQAPSDTELASLATTGRVGWKLGQEQSQQVVQSELQQWKDKHEKAELYLANLKGFLHNNVLSVEGRRELRKLRANLGLSDAEVAAIESKIVFRDESKARR